MNRLVRWFRFMLKRHEFDRRMHKMAISVAQGRWYVFREEPTWLLVWLKKIGPPSRANMDAMGMSSGVQAVMQRTYEQGMTEFELRFRPVVQMLQAALRKQGLSDELIENMSTHNIENMNGDAVMLGDHDPVVSAKDILSRIDEIEVVHEHMVVDEDGNQRMVSHEEFMDAIKDGGGVTAEIKREGGGP